MEATRQAWPQHRSLFRRSRWAQRGIVTAMLSLGALAALLAMSFEAWL